MARAAAATNYSDTQNKLICANILLSKFADVNIANEDGDTPLIAGSKWDFIELWQSWDDIELCESKFDY